MAHKWSNQQESIFEWFRTGKGNLVVRARAGTGKTTSILEGITGAPEEKILLAAFNKKIAEELQSRVQHPGAECKTLHSLGFSYILSQWRGVKVDKERGDRLAQRAIETVMGMVKAADMEEWEHAGSLPQDRPQPLPLYSDVARAVTKLAGVAKGMIVNATVKQLKSLAYDFETLPSDMAADDGWTVEHIAHAACIAMEYAAQPDGSIDFDDMVFVPVRNGWVRPRYGLVVIDECQDMNASQIALAIGACKRGGRIAVVGDNCQAVYGFRGADSGSLDRLKIELKAQEMGLTITRRCPQLIVDLAKELVPDFEAAPNAPPGTITTVSTKDLPALVEIGDFVLSRKNAPLASACLKILREGKRARVEGRDIGAGLVALVNKLATGRAAGSMPAWLDRLSVWEDKECSRWKAAKKPAKVDEMRDRADTLRALSEGLTGVPELVRRISELFTDNAQDQRCVVLSSIHRSKGLEADRVFILRDTLYPGGREDQEEKNLEYVAITRSKRDLIWLDDKMKPTAVLPGKVA